MAIQFNQHKGSAQKTSIETFQYVDGDNKMRIVGDILARYVYWIQGENAKNIPLECLSFDRNTEKFNNLEKFDTEAQNEFIKGAKIAYENIVVSFASGNLSGVKQILSKKVYDQFEKAINDSNCFINSKAQSLKMKI